MSNTAGERDAQPARTHTLSLSIITALVLGIIAWGLAAPDHFATQLQKEAGVFEHATPAVLLPGILLALFAAVKYRTRVALIVVAWIVVWSVACTYFAGEESSWGQWYFGWESPEWFESVNDQGETNLHNMSSWADQKPRMMVELFIFIAGALLPTIRLFEPKDKPQTTFFQRWVIAPTTLLPAAYFFLLVRIAGWTPASDDALGDSELCEFSIALFLSLYLISFFTRLRALPTPSPSPDAADQPA